jgi:hypothetical protein
MLMNFAFRNVLAAGEPKIGVVATDVMDAVLVFPGVTTVPNWSIQLTCALIAPAVAVPSVNESVDSRFITS